MSSCCDAVIAEILPRNNLPRNDNHQPRHIITYRQPNRTREQERRSSRYLLPGISNRALWYSQHDARRTSPYVTITSGPKSIRYTAVVKSFLSPSGDFCLLPVNSPIGCCCCSCCCYCCYIALLSAHRSSQSSPTATDRSLRGLRVFYSSTRPFFFLLSLLLSSSTRRRFHPQRPSGHAVVTGVVRSPPGTCVQFLSRIGFSIPTARRFSSNVVS